MLAPALLAPALLAAALLGAPALAPGAGRAQPAPAARFDWFAYEGRDRVYEAVRAGPNEYLNPILAGFYPDPSVVRVGRDYYLVTSSFAYFPGVPVFRSRDLVRWTQVGHVIDRPSQLRLDSLGTSRGVFAPAISYHDGTFYVAGTCVDCGGTFVVTAQNPAGPWSDPAWLPDVEGIDPSLFFDDDGRAYLVNNRAPAGPPRYEGHRAIWLQAYDVRARRTVGPAAVLVDGGVDITQRPAWIEGPHLYKVAGRYYLSAAEGGTGADHRQVVFRSDRVLGPYAPGPDNPILTQRHLDPARPFPVTSAGHADFVRTPAGDWWAVFLGVRPYAEDYHNTGRETFLLPVRWDGGWPRVAGGTGPVPYAARRPALPRGPAPLVPTSGNFAVRDEFDGPRLAPDWVTVRTPRGPWYDLASAPGTLTLHARPDDIAGRGRPAFVARRQQHARATFTTAMRWAPARAGDAAGLVAFQSDAYFYALVVARDGGRTVVQLRRRAGADDAPAVVASAPIALVPNAPVYLRVEADGARYRFAYGQAPGHWTPLGGDFDGRILSTRVAGGFGANFTGVVVGMYARAGP